MIHVLRYTEELEKVGFTTEQAKKSVQLWMDLMDQNFATKGDFKEHYFMTKADLNEVRSEMNEVRSEMKELKIDLQAEMNEVRSEMKELKTELNANIKAAELTLTIRMGVMMAASIGLITALTTFIKS
ncbi:MAG: hypothetical protein ACOYL6_14345 [Bacteriovoracaceae bacterium]